MGFEPTSVGILPAYLLFFYSQILLNLQGFAIFFSFRAKWRVSNCLGYASKVLNKKRLIMAITFLREF